MLSGCYVSSCEPPHSHVETPTQLAKGKTTLYMVHRCLYGSSAGSAYEVNGSIIDQRLYVHIMYYDERTISSRTALITAYNAVGPSHLCVDTHPAVELSMLRQCQRGE